MTLSETERVKLRLFGWRYQFYVMGFDLKTALHLVFIKHWVRRGMLGGAQDGAS